MSMGLKLIQCQRAIYVRGVSRIATDYLKSAVSSPCVNVAEPLLQERGAAGQGRGGDRACRHRRQCRVDMSQ